MQLLVFDVGGSHIAGARCDVEHLRLSAREVVPVDANGSEGEFYGALDRLTASLSLGDLQGMSFAFPGPFDYRAGVSYLTHKFASLHGKNLRMELAERYRLESKRIQFLNDADAFLLGEMSQMDASQDGRTIGITLGTGVGSAFAVAGKIIRSGDGVPPDGEIWNLPWRGGIVEDAISTRGIQSLYEKRNGQRREVREIAERSSIDVDAVATFLEFGEALGDVLHSVAAEFRPATVIFGGAISRSAELFLPFTARLLPGNIALRVSTLFEDAALLGAAVHWQREFQ